MNAYRSATHIAALLAALGSAVGIAFPVRSACIEPLGDVNGDGVASIVDVQCSILATLWTIEGGIQPVPACLPDDFGPADVNCTGNIDVSDINLTIIAVLGVPISPVIDSNANGCVDACDLCGDGLCASSMNETCLGCPDDCGVCAGACCTAHAGPGCADPWCSACVCDSDPGCCLGTWTAACAALAQACDGACGCSDLCGNGILDPGESCDPQIGCPATCDDGNPCTIDTLSGAPVTCDAVCTHTPATSCTPDGCCPVTQCGPVDDVDCDDDFDYLTYWPSPWASFEDAVFGLVNSRRAAGATCGAAAYPPVPPLAPLATLRASARYHSLDMATWPCAQHDDCDGSRTATQRIVAFGFSGQLLAENITAGWPMTPTIAVQWLMDSESHCKTIMNGSLSLMGVGYANFDDAPYKNYVTIAFGTPFP